MTSDPLNLLSPRPARKVWPLLLAAAAVALVLGVGGTLLALQLTGSDVATTPVVGKVDLALDGSNFADSMNCFGKGGYEDIHAGAQVVITDATGATVAVTSLKRGEFEAGADDHPACVFKFETSVPAGKGFYGIEVSHRGKVQIAEGELGNVRLGIGG